MQESAKNYSPLFIRWCKKTISPSSKESGQKTISPLFVRGGEGVFFSRLYFAQTERTPLFPLFKRGEMRLFFPPLRKRG
jgi:hypothetical protein